MKAQPVISACDGEPAGVYQPREPTLSCLHRDTAGLSHLHTLNINALLSSINDSTFQCIITCVRVDIPRPPGKHTASL
ncbi:hypothetical protein PBY51_016333 [Eleginops maclovinus]|uniref:Uncharacterized protein n=1 Tax=Eleginops maclovinus TaxID=56733 RepID=A0AAN7XN22_ELEMC|nr:hypothetical protein PBY51_016333 [Eleginops maclovinus]